MNREPIRFVERWGDEQVARADDEVRVRAEPEERDSFRDSLGSRAIAEYIDLAADAEDDEIGIPVARPAEALPRRVQGIEPFSRVSERPDEQHLQPLRGPSQGGADGSALGVRSRPEARRVDAEVDDADPSFVDADVLDELPARTLRVRDDEARPPERDSLRRPGDQVVHWRALPAQFRGGGMNVVDPVHPSGNEAIPAVGDQLSASAGTERLDCGEQSEQWRTENELPGRARRDVGVDVCFRDEIRGDSERDNVGLVAKAGEVARQRVVCPIHSPRLDEVAGDDDVGAACGHDESGAMGAGRRTARRTRSSGIPLALLLA